LLPQPQDHLLESPVQWPENGISLEARGRSLGTEIVVEGQSAVDGGPKAIFSCQRDEQRRRLYGIDAEMEELNQLVSAARQEVVEIDRHVSS
jgi:hypothetical protein